MEVVTPEVINGVASELTPPRGLDFSREIV
jgi:hypothetical protein